MTVVRINIEKSVRHKKLICSTRQGKESTWYTGRTLRYETGGGAWLVCGTKRDEDTAGTPQWFLVYEMYGKKDLYTR